MSKPTVVRIFVGSLLALFGGLILMFGSMIAASVAGALVMNGPDVAGVQNSVTAWVLVALAVVGFFAMLAGALGQFVAWIGAVINTAQLADKTWFIILLVLGLLSFGFVAMLVYVIAGPDGTAPQPAAPAGRPVPTA